MNFIVALIAVFLIALVVIDAYAPLPPLSLRHLVAAALVVALAVTLGAWTAWDAFFAAAARVAS